MRKRLCAFALLLALLLQAACSLADTGAAICLADAMENAVANRPRILYTGRTKIDLTMRSAADKESAALGSVGEGTIVSIFGFDQTWLFCWSDSVGIYYLGRHNVDEITPVSEDIAPYGVVPNRYIAVAARDTSLRTAPDASAEEIVPCPAGSRFSLWLIQDGWAVVPYKREIGYLYVGDLCELTPVSPSADYAEEGDILAAFTTYYSLKNTELNTGRIENIRVGCAYISRTYLPGETFDFNAIAGPYRKSRGYMPSPVLVDGGSVAGYGGGTCQVSTTLYNALLQLSDGITILWRRPHGPSGATYAPHGVDAAVGAPNLNLIFRNDYPFPITIESTVESGFLCICIRKGAA